MIRDTSAATSPLSDGDTASTTPRSSLIKVNETLLCLTQSNDPNSKLEAAKQIRRLTKTSPRYRRYFSNAVKPLVEMLRSHSLEANQTALLALLNLAVKDQKNKTSIVDAGALEPIIKFLKSERANLQEDATAALLTLSATSINKPVISTSGAIPLLVEIVENGSSQAKADAVMALYNLSTHLGNLDLILRTQPIPYFVGLLKSSKKSSKTAEKCIALIESLADFDEAKTAIISEEGGMLAIVEMLESGTCQSREHAVGALLKMCESNRSRYREPILKEGVIPGLLELTVQGTPKSQSKAHTLLRLLRDSPYPRSDLEAETLENIVCRIISQIDEETQSGKAKQMLSDMVQVSMEQSLKHLQEKALECSPANELPIANSASEVPSK